MIDKLKGILNHLDFEKDTDFYIKKHCGVWVIVKYLLFGDGIVLHIALSKTRKKIRIFAKYADIIMSSSDISSTKIVNKIDFLCINGLHLM